MKRIPLIARRATVIHAPFPRSLAGCRIWILLSVLVSIAGCAVNRQLHHATNLVQCDFRLLSVEKVNLAGIEIKNDANLNDLTWAQAGELMSLLATSSAFPLKLQLNIEGKNPNNEPAGLNRMDYMLFIDGIQMTAGTLDDPFLILPGSTSVIPVQITVDLKHALQGKSLDAILNFGFNLAGVGNKPTRFTIKVRPAVMIGNKSLTSPGYITIRTGYSGR